MSKQGVMVFYVDIGNMPAHRGMEFVERIKNTMMEDMKDSELHDNYDLLFFPTQFEGERGTKVEVFPYKDYKLSIQDMTTGEIENYIETEILSRLQGP